MIDTLNEELNNDKLNEELKDDKLDEEFKQKLPTLSEILDKEFLDGFTKSIESKYVGKTYIDKNELFEILEDIDCDIFTYVVPEYLKKVGLDDNESFNFKTYETDASLHRNVDYYSYYITNEQNSEVGDICFEVYVDEQIEFNKSFDYDADRIDEIVECEITGFNIHIRDY